MNFDYLAKYLDKSLFPPSNISIKEGLPFLMENSEQAFSELSFKCSLYLQQEKERLADLKKSMRELTKNKIEKHIEGRAKQLNRLKKILGGFYTEKTAPGVAALNPYEELIFRDWCWDSPEIDDYAAYLAPLSSKESHLFLGAGACGLSYKVASMTEEAEVIAADINPFLMLASHKLLSGKSLKMTDTPHFPSSQEHIVESFNVSPQKKINNHHQVFADFLNLPFVEGSFDHINATWFLDVIGPELEDSLKNIIFHLKRDGVFTYIGPSNFHKKTLNESLLPEEILDLLERHFEVVHSEFRTLDYLNSGYNSQVRVEKVLFITAEGPRKKTGKRLVPEVKSGFKLDDKLRFKIAESHTLSQILRHISGDMTYEELAKKIQAEFGFDFNQALAYAKAVIGKIQS